ncbi:DUF6152 family protein [Candidatus Rariloculus sp.]|uniref:DUF6152 family protein n=1 Tax=Candidatus Rariloculus sp. TaxID=3101265 RepID=UPI003D0BDE70
MWHPAALLALLAFTGIAYAHHSQVGIFGSDETIEITGIIKSVSWRNPHGQILLDVTDEDGNVVEWDVETASISVLRNRGVESSSIVVGDTVTMAGAPSTRNRPEILARSVLLPSGYEFTFGNRDAHFPEGKAGRIVGRAVIEANAEEAIANADGIFRVWSTIMSDPEQFPIFKGGYPLSEAGEAGWAEWNPRDNVLLKCGTKGQPLIMITPLPIEFVREGDDIVMRIEEYDSIRRIHMSPDAVAPPGHTLMGFSRGRWEGTTLVVETDRIAAGYFDHHGVPQSDQIRTVERFMPTEAYDRLDYSLTTTDPVNFAEPFTLARYFVWKPENSVHPYECLDRF